MAKITKIFARQVIDSRGNPTVEAEVTLDDGSFGRSIVPSGASTGTREALELRDGDKSKWQGKSVLKAVDNINKKIAPKLIGSDSYNQAGIDNAMLALDGTKGKDGICYKSNLGANAILAVSLANAQAAAKSKKVPFYKWVAQLGGNKEFSIPNPMLNVVNGGEHADNSIDFQEYMIYPIGAPTFSEAMRWSSEVFHTLKSIFKKEGHNTAVGDEGGFAPNLKSNKEALVYIMKAIKEAGYAPGKDFYIAMDVAASEFYDTTKKLYNLKGENRSLTTDQMINYLDELATEFPVISIEDGLAEQDWDGWKKWTDKMGSKIQIVGDDLFVTNPKILEEGIKKGVANAILIKVNQIGTLTETIEAINMAKKAGYNSITSHRSGETEDTSIADIAVGMNTMQIKTGSMSRTDRIAKYNQLLRIEEEVKTYAGKKAFKNLK